MFKFKGISSDSMGVIVEEEEHFLARAPIKYESTSIDGRNGDIIEMYGYANVERPIKVQILNKSNIDAIFEWLSGEGEFEYKGRVTKAFFLEILEPVRSSSIFIVDFMFIRAPLWHLSNDDYQEVTDTVINCGNTPSKPLIRIEKGNENDIELSIGAIRFSYEFNDDEYVEIDCEKISVTYKGLSRDRMIKIGYQFPILYPGENKILIHSGDPQIKIKRKDYFL